MDKCSKCGFVAEFDSARFCPNCGAPMLVGLAENASLGGFEIATPGRRWFARLFDLWLGCFIAGLAKGIMAPEFVIDATIMQLLSVAFALCLEGLEYWVLGGTFGKWAFSIKVIDSQGAKIGSAEYGKRLLSVWCAGLGFGVPIAFLVTEVWQYRRLKKGFAASYDEKAGRMVAQYKQGFLKNLLCILFFLAGIALSIIGNSIG